METLLDRAYPQDKSHGSWRTGSFRGRVLFPEPANQVMQESGVMSGAMLKVDPGQAGRVEQELSDMTGVSSISSKRKELDNEK